MSEDSRKPPSEQDALTALARVPTTDSLEVERMSPGAVRIYQVLEQDLIALQSGSEQETLRLAFFCACGGAFASAVLGWTTSGSMDPAHLAAYVSGSLLLGVLTLFFGIGWWLSRRDRKARIKAIMDVKAGQSQRFAPIAHE